MHIVQQNSYFTSLHITYHNYEKNLRHFCKPVSCFITLIWENNSLRKRTITNCLLHYFELQDKVVNNSPEEDG